MQMNLLMTRRYVEIVVKTRSVSSFWDKSAGNLIIGRATTGVEGA